MDHSENPFNYDLNDLGEFIFDIPSRCLFTYDTLQTSTTSASPSNESSMRSPLYVIPPLSFLNTQSNELSHFSIPAPSPPHSSSTHGK